MLTKETLLDWLRKIDQKLKQHITLVAVGGTAMTLRNMKESTRDVDFCLSSDQADSFQELTKDSPFHVDIFVDGFIFSEQLPTDFVEKAIVMDVNLENIELRALSPIDIILTKAARYNERDEEDIATISKRCKLDKEDILSRFEEIKDTYSGREEDYEYHINLIVKRYFAED
ncbi:hypothetical protein COV93_06865 [Candidatus Woesearchaeota archaeon CG11_big_fil_rev_8_21_14_0_20_43_8]|nr:MAG: hypothetical protein COV93_06865 [Candidatus Woesearchaeota archaeon CG11_big_fil_rev_8_21_14_0_20_43_8]